MKTQEELAALAKYNSAVSAVSAEHRKKKASATTQEALAAALVEYQGARSAVAAGYRREKERLNPCRKQKDKESSVRQQISLLELWSRATDNSPEYAASLAGQLSRARAELANLSLDSPASPEWHNTGVIVNIKKD